MTRQSRIATIFAVAATVVVVSIAVLCAMAMATIRTHRQVLRCRILIDQVQQTLSTLKDAATGQRGYLLTGNERYLEPYLAALTQIHGELATLSQMAKAGDLLGDDVAALMRLADQKLASLDKTIEIRRTKGLPAALAIVETGFGKRVMDAFRADAARIIDRENSGLSESIRHANALTFYSGVVVVTTGILDVLVLLWAYRRTTAEVRRKEEAALELHRQKNLLEVTLASIGDAVMVTDTQGKITFVNEVAEKVTGWKSYEAINQPCVKIFKIVNEETRQPVESPVDRVLRLGTIVGLANHTVLVRKDGGELPIDDSGAPIREPDGTLRGTVLVFRDFSEQKAAERQMTQANEALHAANQAKDQFLAALSHELRAPLTPVLAALTNWEVNDEFPPSFLADIKVVRRNVELEARLIDDLLDLTRIAKGKLLLNLEVIGAHELVESVIAMYQSQLTAKRANLSVDLKATRQHLKADPARIQQVFGNILNNAIKFINPGGRIEIASSTDPQGRFNITFADDGIGMSQDTISRIFLPFEQGRDDDPRSYAGLGLGMSIAKALVDAHVGEIAAASDGPERGSVFTVRLPTVDEPARKSFVASDLHQLNSPGSKDFSILYVEDHADSAEMLTQLLRGLGYQVETCGTVADAVRLAKEQEFDLLLSDIGLPDGTGIDLIAQVRQHCSMPAIALTGFGMERDIEAYRRAGFNSHIAKPVTLQKLETLIDQFRRHRRQ